MTRVQYYCAATLDGYIADANDGLDWLTGFEGSYAGDEAEPGPMSDGGSYESFYAEVGALVSGSATYEFVLEHTSEGGAWPYAGKPYWVLSSRDLPAPSDQAADVRIVRGEVSELIDEMLASAGEDNLWIVGGGNVASQFAAAGLLGELHLTDRAGGARRRKAALRLRAPRATSARGGAHVRKRDGRAALHASAARLTAPAASDSFAPSRQRRRGFAGRAGFGDQGRSRWGRGI